MAKNVNFSCDACYKVLWGREKAAMIKKDSLQFRGQMLLKRVDPKTGYEDLIFISPAKDAEMSFCDEECLNDYIRMRTELWKTRKENQLREEANHDHDFEGGSGFVVGNKKGRSY